MRVALAERALAHVDDEDATLVHDLPEIDGALGLADDVAQGSGRQHRIELVQDRRDHEGAEGVVIGAELVAPIRQHNRIANAGDDARPVDIVGQQAGDRQQGRAGRFHEGPDRIAQHLLRAIGDRRGAPDVHEGRHDVVGHHRVLVGVHLLQHVEPDRPLQVGGVEIHELMRPMARHQAEHGLCQIAQGIDDSHTAAGGQVLADHVGQQRRLAGAGLADDMQMPPARAVIKGEHLTGAGIGDADDQGTMCVHVHGPTRTPRSNRHVP